MPRYELVRAGRTHGPATIVSDLPVIEVGEIIFDDGRFWRVERVEPAKDSRVDGRLILSLTTDAPPTATT